jgi:hypothetical protein
VSLFTEWEVQGQALPEEPRLTCRASVAVCRCGFHAVYPHCTYQPRLADEMADSALAGHRCERAA